MHRCLSSGYRILDTHEAFHSTLPSFRCFSPPWEPSLTSFKPSRTSVRSNLRGTWIFFLFVIHNKKFPATKKNTVDSPFWCGFQWDREEKAFSVILKPCGFSSSDLHCCRSQLLQRQRHNVWGLRRAIPRRNVWMAVAWKNRHLFLTPNGFADWPFWGTGLAIIWSLVMCKNLGGWWFIFEICRMDILYDLGCKDEDHPFPWNNEADRAFLESSSFVSLIFT